MVSIHITDLTSELMLKIFSYLDVGYLNMNVKLVCKSWKCLAEDLEDHWNGFTIKNRMNASFITNVIVKYPNLQSLDISFCVIDPSVILALNNHCVNLNSLEIRNCFSAFEDCIYCVNRCFPFLEDLRLPNLKWLLMETCDFHVHQSSIFTQLAACSPDLEFLFFKSCDIHILCSEYFDDMLAHLHKLEILVMESTWFSTEFDFDDDDQPVPIYPEEYGFHALSEAINLRYLDLSSQRGLRDEVLISVLEKCSNLQYLNIGDLTHLNESTIQLVFKLRFSSLKHVILSGCGLHDNAFGFIDRCSKLRVLTIHNCANLNGNFLLKICKLFNIEELLLHEGHLFNSLDINTMFKEGNFSQLHTLSLINCNLDDSCLKSISTSSYN